MIYMITYKEMFFHNYVYQVINNPISLLNVEFDDFSLTPNHNTKQPQNGHFFIWLRQATCVLHLLLFNVMK